MSTAPASNNPSELYKDGFTAIRRGLSAHLMSGKMTAAMFPVFFVLLQQCDWSTGVWNGNAHRIYYALGGSMSLSDIRKNLVKLGRQLYIKSFHYQGRKGNYNILINRYIPTQGELRGKVLNATASTSCETPVYAIESDERVSGVSADCDEHVTSVSEESDERPYQDIQDVQAFQDVQAEQEVKSSKIDSSPCSPTQSKPNGQVDTLTADLSEMADEEGYDILFEDARKNALAVLLRQFTPEQLKAAWAEYLDKHVDGGEFTVSHAARIFTETAEQLIHVINRRAKKDQDRDTENEQCQGVVQ